MLDPRLIRTDLDQVAETLSRRGFVLDTDMLRRLEERRKALQVTTEQLKAERNSRSKAIGALMKDGNRDAAEQAKAEVGRLKAELESVEQQFEEVAEQLNGYLMGVPNLPDPSVPSGQDEADNEELRRWGTPATRDFPVVDHVDVGERLQGLDFEAAAGLTGSRFVVMRGAVARLHRALAQFMLDTHTEQHGYLELNVPFIVNGQALVGTGQLPKFEEDQFRLDSEQDFWLSPTAEVPVTNLVRDQILAADLLPLRLTAHTPCFRSEAGSYGRDTRGMIRQHQFEKVELVHIVRPDEADAALEALTGHAEEVLRRLELPYRVVSLCGGDIGFAAARTFDIEVWLPGQQRYREISSCSQCGDFQARRMRARWRNPDTGRPELVHTLNGSGVAAGRALIAVVENGQQAVGRVALPAALQPYLGGRTHIGG